MKIQAILDHLDRSGTDYRFAGDPAAEISSYSVLNAYEAGTLAWVRSAADIPVGLDMAGVKLAIIQQGVDTAAQNSIYTPESRRIFFALVDEFFAEEEEAPGIGQGCYISPRVKLGKNVRIGHNCTLDGDIEIGDDTVIGHNVVLTNRIRIGQRCHLQSGCILGHDDIAYTMDEQGRRSLIRHHGGIRLGNDVYLGAGTVIHRATMKNSDTELRDGCCIDAQCFISHNCLLEEDVMLAGGAVIYGNCHLEKNSYVASGLVRNGRTVGEGATVGMGGVVVKDVPPKMTVVGNPARVFEGQDKSPHNNNGGQRL